MTKKDSLVLSNIEGLLLCIKAKKVERRVMERTCPFPSFRYVKSIGNALLEVLEIASKNNVSRNDGEKS